MTVIKKDTLLQDLQTKLQQIKPNLPDNIPPDDHLKNTWGLDSMDLVEFVARIEYQYKIIIPDDVLPQFHTLNNVMQYLDENLS